MDEGLKYSSVYDEKTVSLFEKDFSRLRDDCYLDHAGATLYSEDQIKNISDDLSSSLYGNPHSVGIASNFSQDIIERMRYRILSHFHTSPEEYSLIFTSGATASLKLIAETFAFGQNGSFVYTQDNHTSVLGMREVVDKRGGRVICLKHDEAFDVFEKENTSNILNSTSDNSLFVYSAQCNFSGLKYPLSWIEKTHSNALFNVSGETPANWYVLLDAASFVPTNDLNLSSFKPDFVCVSFYKMFGYPTGIGALLVRNSSAKVLDKIYYGGGTVEVSLSSEMFHAKRSTLHQRFEDGTVPFLSITSLKYGFDILSKITMNKISEHVFSLSKFLHHSLLTLHHGNGKPVVKLYSDTDYENIKLQGGIVTFNLIRSNGEHVGYMEVASIASLFKIHLRTGCFCNPGACQRHLGLSDEEILQNYDAGYVCGGTADLINGKPTGAVRISFGYMSTIENIRTLLLMISKAFVDGKPIRIFPQWWEGYKIILYRKYNQFNFRKSHSTKDDRIINAQSDLPYEEQHFPTDGSIRDSIERVKDYKKKCQLARLFIYPIKSCAAYELDGPWNLNSRGLEFDREWMVMTTSGVCLTQKQNVNLCLIRPVINKKEGVMTLSYPGMPSIDVELNDRSNDPIKAAICQSRVCGHKVEGTDCGLEVAEWLSLSLGRPNLRLVRQTSQNNEKHESKKPELSFSSQAQYLALSQETVSWLSDKVSDKSEVQRDTMLHRFRGNMVFKGCEAFEETQWKRVEIGENEFLVNGLCTRCQMICIDQTTGEKTVEPLRTLAEELHGKLRFGIYLTRETKGEAMICVGDAVRCSR